MIIKEIDLKYVVETYKQGALNLLRNKAIKAFDGKILIIDEKFYIKEKVDIDKLNVERIENFLSDGEFLYFPFVDSFDSFVTAINGIDFDLDEGLEPEWLEGVGYVQSSERLVDIGDLTISPSNTPGFIIWKTEDFNLSFGEYFKNDCKCLVLDNIGFLKQDILDFINKK